MANISSASGTIEILGSEEVVKTILNLFEKTDTWDYNTSVDMASLENPSTDTYTANFWGSGRWVYQENIERMFRWLKDEIGALERVLLENSDFGIIFSFTDYEPGCEAFYRATDALRHKRGIKLEETEYVQGDCEQLDLSWGNRLDNGFEDDDSLASMLDDMDDDEMKEFLEQEAEGLKKHYGCSLLDLLDQLSLILPGNRNLKEKYLKQQKLLM